jgi:hypothetical protein
VELRKRFINATKSVLKINFQGSHANVGLSTFSSTFTLKDIIITTSQYFLVTERVLIYTTEQTMRLT